jgi:hypothetical protein
MGLMKVAKVVVEIKAPRHLSTYGANYANQRRQRPTVPPHTAYAHPLHPHLVGYVLPPQQHLVQVRAADFTRPVLPPPPLHPTCRARSVCNTYNTRMGSRR